MRDLVERLRDQGRDAFSKQYSLGMFKLCTEAADEIELLRKETGILRDVLMNPDPDSEPDNVRLHREKCDALDQLRIAKELLREFLPAAVSDDAKKRAAVFLTSAYRKDEQ